MKPESVLDTNVLISGILWRGIPFELLSRAEQGKSNIRITICELCFMNHE